MLGETPGKVTPPKWIASLRVSLHQDHCFRLCGKNEATEVADSVDAERIAGQSKQLLHLSGVRSSGCISSKLSSRASRGMNLLINGDDRRAHLRF